MAHCTTNLHLERLSSNEKFRFQLTKSEGRTSRCEVLATQPGSVVAFLKPIVLCGFGTGHCLWMELRLYRHCATAVTPTGANDLSP